MVDTALHKAENGGEKSCCGSRRADIKRCFLLGNITAASLHSYGAFFSVSDRFEPEAFHARKEAFGIIGEKYPFKGCGAFFKHGNKKSPVCDALRTGNPDQISVFSPCYLTCVRFYYRLTGDYGFIRIFDVIK